MNRNRGFLLLLLLFLSAGSAAEPERGSCVFVAEKGSAALFREDVFRLSEQYPEWGCRLISRDNGKEKVMLSLSTVKRAAGEYDTVPIGFAGEVFFVSVHNSEEFTRKDAEELLAGKYRFWREARLPVRTVFLLGIPEFFSGDKPQKPPRVLLEDGALADALLKREPTSVCIVPLEKIPAVSGGNVKMLSVDGIQPTPADVASGKYPMVRFYWLSCRKDAPEAVRNLFRKAQTPDFRRKLLQYGIIQRKD